METIESRLIEIVVAQLGVDASLVVPQAKFVDDLVRTPWIELMMALEEAFDTGNSDEEAEKIHTVQDALDLIKAAQPV